MPFSVTGTGLTDLVMLRIGVLSAAIVSEIVIGVMPPPVILAVFLVILADAGSLTRTEPVLFLE